MHDIQVAWRKRVHPQSFGKLSEPSETGSKDTLIDVRKEGTEVGFLHHAEDADLQWEMNGFGGIESLAG